MLARSLGTNLGLGEFLRQVTNRSNCSAWLRNQTLLSAIAGSLQLLSSMASTLRSFREASELRPDALRELKRQRRHLAAEDIISHSRTRTGFGGNAMDRDERDVQTRLVKVVALKGSPLEYLGHEEMGDRRNFLTSRQHRQ